VIIQHIYECAPYDWFALKEQILDANIDTEMTLVDSLIGQVGEAIRPIRLESIVVVQDNANATITSNISENDIEQLIQSIINNTAPETSG
jgi:hypothetical protein